MTSITIAVPGDELENITIELSEEEVRALYLLRKEQSANIAQLTKELESSKSSEKWACSARDGARNELIQGHTLLTALGVPDKTDHEESYLRKDLEITTRIALYIAAKK